VLRDQVRPQPPAHLPAACRKDCLVRYHTHCA
jgi:hypothetical protein